MGWLWNIFIFSAVVFISVVLFYVGIEFGYASFLNNKIQEAQKGIDEKKDKIDPEVQKDLTEFYSQVFNVNQLLPKHNIISRLFNFLEANTNTSIYYTDLQFLNDTQSLTIKGKTDSLELVARELEALRGRPEVSEIVLNDASGEDNEVVFEIRMILDNHFLLKK